MLGRFEEESLLHCRSSFGANHAPSGKMNTVYLTWWVGGGAVKCGALQLDDMVKLLYRRL